MNRAIAAERNAEQMPRLRDAGRILKAIYGEHATDEKGGPGSGYHDHLGRPGKRGGSQARGDNPGKVGQTREGDNPRVEIPVYRISGAETLKQSLGRGKGKIHMLVRVHGGEIIFAKGLASSHDAVAYAAGVNGFNYDDHVRFGGTHDGLKLSLHTSQPGLTEEQQSHPTPEVDAIAIRNIGRVVRTLVRHGADRNSTLRWWIPTSGRPQDATFAYWLGDEPNEGTKGGPGSGYHDHPGRPGKRGGSLPRGESPGPAAPAKSRAALLRERLDKVGKQPLQRQIDALQARNDALEAKVKAFESESDADRTRTFYSLPEDERHRIVDEHNKVRDEYYRVRDELKVLSNKTVQAYADAFRAENPTTTARFTGTLPMRRDQAVPGTVTTIMQSVGKARQVEFDTAIGQVLGMVDASRFPKGEAFAVDGKRGGARGQYVYGQRTLLMHSSGGQKTLAHEIGHFLEDTIPGLAAKAEAFRNERCKGDKIVRLPAIEGYGSDERGYRDKFIHPYMGKVYGAGYARSTEIVSMGVEMLLTNPHKLAREDPPYFDFIVNALQG